MEHWLNIEKLISNFSNEKLAYYYNRHNRPEATAHFEFEDALASIKATGIEHIPEVCPNKD